MWEKEKMLPSSIFSFSHNVFKRLHSQELNRFNSIPNRKILDWFRLKTFSACRITGARTKRLTIENKMRKEKNACYQHYLLFPQHCLKPFSAGQLNMRLSAKGLKYIQHFSMKPLNSGSCFSVIF